MSFEVFEVWKTARSRMFVMSRSFDQLGFTFETFLEKGYRLIRNIPDYTVPYILKNVFPVKLKTWECFINLFYNLLIHAVLLSRSSATQYVFSSKEKEVELVAKFSRLPSCCKRIYRRTSAEFIVQNTLMHGADFRTVWYPTLNNVMTRFPLMLVLILHLIPHSGSPLLSYLHVKEQNHTVLLSHSQIVDQYKMILQFTFIGSTFGWQLYALIRSYSFVKMFIIPNVWSKHCSPSVIRAWSAVHFLYLTPDT